MPDNYVDAPVPPPPQDSYVHAPVPPPPKDAYVDAPVPAPPKYPYNADVQAGKYPVTGPIDAFAQSIAEPGEKYVAPIVGTLDAARRGVASLVGGQGVVKSLKNTAPAWMGGTPEDAPSMADTADTLGFPKVADEPGFDKEGNINWGNVLSSKIPNTGRELVAGFLTDPVQWAGAVGHPGYSPAFKEAQAAARDAVRVGSVGGFATKEAAEAALVLEWKKLLTISAK